MSIIQISKIQQRSGDLVDLPQLSEAEFGFATDEKRLFIGKTLGNSENIEVLTAYSHIAFDQLDGGTGNLNIQANTLANGQVLAYDGTSWVNKGGIAGGLITLGSVSNVKITGGLNGYVLQTDGLGNLSWTSQTGGGGNGTVSGANTQIQFNDAGSFGASGNLTFDKTTNVMTVTNANIGNTVTTSISTGGNSTPGTITGNWTLTAGSKLQATYADLAEYYAADKHYGPGTVLEFGGDKEVTIAKEETSKLAGVVSSEPAYVMNGNIQTDYPVIIALVGRVKVKVIGTVSKGDMLVSAGKGFAKASILTPKVGTVIGKAIENKNTSDEGFVEVMVGRI